MQGLDRPLRHALCHGIWTDIDIVNCQPTLYLQLLQKYKRECPYLEEYVSNRDEVLKTISEDRDEAKHLVLTLMYGASPKGSKNEFVQNFSQEMRSHHEFLASNYRDTFEYCKKADKTYPESSCASMVVGQIENGILKVIVEEAERRKIKVGTLMFDGAFIKTVPENFLEDVSGLIFQETGYDVKLICKEMEPYDFDALKTKYGEMEVEEEEEEECEEFKELRRLAMEGHIGIAKLIKRYHGESIVNSGGDGCQASYYGFNDRNGLWESKYTSDIMVQELEFIRVKLQTILRKEEGEDPDPLTAVVESLKYVNTMSNVMQVLGSVLRDENFQKKMNSNKELLSVKNGALDLRQKLVRPRRKDDYFTYEIPLTYDPKHADREKVFELLDQITLGTKLKRSDYTTYLISLLGYGITGYASLECVGFLTGETGANGKGLIMLFMSLILTKQLFYTMPASVIRGSKGGKDPGAATSYLMRLFQARVTWIDELPDAPIDEQVFKELSGGANIAARELHGTQDEFAPTHTMFINCNRIPKMNTASFMMRRTLALPFDAKFRIENHTDEKLRYNMNDPTHFPMDTNLKDRIQRGELVEGFLSVVVDGAADYLKRGDLPTKPQCCHVKAEDVRFENDRVRTFLDEECVEDEVAVTPASLLFQKYKSFSRPARPGKKIEFVQDMIEKGYEYQKRSCQKGAYCFLGIRYNTEEYGD
jgi:phage/plasmid-associated DNA primase